MADFNKMLKAFEEELTCPVCRDIFTNPKTLKCLHSCCLDCISRLIESGNASCPTCRATTGLKKDDIPSLRSSFYLNSLLQLYKDMNQGQSELPGCANCEKRNISVAYCPQCEGVICKACLEAHGLGAFVKHQATLFSDFKTENVNCYIKNRMHCQVEYHNKNKLDFYCTKCQDCICLACIATELHKPHRKVTIEEAAEEMKKLIKLDMGKVLKIKETYERELELSKQNMTRIEQETDAAIKKVSDAVEQHIKVLREHETTVIETLQRKLQQERTQNEEEQKEVCDGIESISEFNLRCQTLLDENVAHFIVKCQQELCQRCEAFLEKPSILCSKPIERNASIRYTPNPQVTQNLKDFGKVLESVTDPSRCSIESLNDIRCGFVNRFEVVTRDSQSEPTVTCRNSIDVQIEDGDGTAVEKEVSQSETGKYTMTFNAQRTCDYTIHVRINGQEIKNSPQTVKTLDVRREFKPVKIFASKGNDGVWCPLKSPMELAVSDSGEVAIADWGNHRIVIFSANGEYLRHFGEEGAGDGQLTDPLGVVFNEDRLLVTDNNNGTGRLQEFDKNGTYCRTIYKQQEVALRGMCTTVDNIAVCCGSLYGQNKSGIKLLNKQSGQLMQEIPSVDEDEVPNYIAYGNDRYFVTYTDKHYIRVFNRNGLFLYKFGEEGHKDGQFDHPCGLAVMTRDTILVCDFANHRVQMLNHEGNSIRSFGSPGTGPGQMYRPMEIAVAPDGQVFVLELGNHRVYVWR